MKKALIFASGSTALRLLPRIKKDYEIIAFLDNDKKRWGMKVAGLEVFPPQKWCEFKFDSIVIASLPGLYVIYNQLRDLGVQEQCIDKHYIENSVESRVLFLKSLALEFEERNILGAVAEGGVFQGEFAKEINAAFPDKKLYLFDTFEGFSKKDIVIEKKYEYSIQGEGHLEDTSVDLVLGKMPYPSNCVIRKGYFPDTTKGVEETFCFVNMDFDLYQPTYEGLKYFYPRMVKKGVILIHDYFGEAYKGNKQAVIKYNEEMGNELNLLPIGDELSIAIIKN